MDKPMDQRWTCPRCSKPISADETVVAAEDHVTHVDCQRPHTLSREERSLLFQYCHGHTVAECAECGGRYALSQLASDMIGNQEHRCPTCRIDLIESVREHLYACTMLPENVRHRAQEARDTLSRLVKQSRELRETAGILMREAEVALKALRDARRERPQSGPE